MFSTWYQELYTLTTYDVKVRALHVAGRDFHFVCGVSAHEFVGVGEDQGHFQLKTIPHECFTMYPEEKLGVGLQSASIMWEHVGGRNIRSY